MEQEAAAGFAASAQQAVAGITATVSAEIDKNLKVTFASIIAMRAVAGDTQAKLELVALSDPSGSRAAGIVTGDFQSFDFEASKPVPAVAASLDIEGFNIKWNKTGLAGNGFEVSFRAWAAGSSPLVNVDGASNPNHLIIVISGARSGNLTIPRADVITRIRTENYPITMTGTGDITVNFDHDRIETFANGTLSGGARATVTKGKGWQLKRDGNLEVDGAGVRGTVAAENVSK